ncbi:MAG: hypothetical protein ACRDO2_10485 [Nocardioidaceae bacterium]
MTSRRVGRSGLEYELTIAGAIGPAVQAALQPLEVESSEIWTTLRTTPLSPAQFFDLIVALDVTSRDIDGVLAVDY